MNDLLLALVMPVSDAAVICRAFLCCHSYLTPSPNFKNGIIASTVAFHQVHSAGTHNGAIDGSAQSCEFRYDHRSRLVYDCNEYELQHVIYRAPLLLLNRGRSAFLLPPILFGGKILASDLKNGGPCNSSLSRVHAYLSVHHLRKAA